jgi:alpha-L-rhamnosidase
MVANMFLVHVLDLMTHISRILGKEADQSQFAAQAQAARSEFQSEYVTSNGRLVSDTQAAYAIAICLDILTPSQRVRAGERLAEIVRWNSFKIATGFAGTPFLCEALAATGHTQVAYSLLVETGCPSWLYPVTMGATTVWERWDSMLPNGDVNPGKMTSFNHYAFGAIAKFMYERLAGLQRLEPGWTKCRIAPLVGGEFSHAEASHITPHGKICCAWETSVNSDKHETFKITVEVPYGTTAEVVIPEGNGTKTETVGAGKWSFETEFIRDYEWPVPPLGPKW